MDTLVRKMELADVNRLVEIDHSYNTDYVWQMDLETIDDQVKVSFREVRLPRSMRVEYPHDPTLLADTWQEKAVILVAEVEQQVAGYLAVSNTAATGISQVTDIVVERRLRRNGVGSALVRQALMWTYEQQTGPLVLEMQSKNYPAVKLAGKMGFEFCGYNDRYYLNQDIALFFAKRR